jgi:hypothetical protein
MLSERMVTMNTKKTAQPSALANLEDAILDSILDLPDDAVDEELRLSGLDPADEVAKGKAAIANGIRLFQKAELASARAELARQKAKQAVGHSSDEIAAGRAQFERMKTGEANGLMMAARKGEGLSENDIEGVAEDLADLEKLRKEPD